MVTGFYKQEYMNRFWRGAVIILVAGIAAWLALVSVERSLDKPYSLIEDGLYVGSSVPEPPSGTRAVLNLCGKEDRYPVEAGLWEPVLEGGKEPDLAWLRRMVEFIASQRRSGVTTYVHCLAGMNRSGAVVTAYLMEEHNWTRDQALAFAHSRRPQIQPDPTFMRLLAEWEQARLHRD